ncbi:hypothetical protein [Desulfosoma sp.]|uniref:hypothetical protein n=1 Tax=Desulfosoma sp. TaxID=2603217 RepID=UPI004048FAA3
MRPAPNPNSVIALMEKLCWHLEALHNAVLQDAEAEVIDQLMSRCGETFALLREEGIFWASARSDHDRMHTAHLQDKLTHLLESYHACLKALSAASAHTAQKLARLQKTRFASQEYRKVAHLG